MPLLPTTHALHISNALLLLSPSKSNPQEHAHHRRIPPKATATKSIHSAARKLQQIYGNSPNFTTAKYQTVTGYNQISRRLCCDPRPRPREPPTFCSIPRNPNRYSVALIHELLKHTDIRTIGVSSPHRTTTRTFCSIPRNPNICYLVLAHYSLPFTTLCT